MAKNFLYLIMSRPILAPFAFAFSIQALNFSDTLVYGFGPPNSQQLNSKTENHQQLLLVVDYKCIPFVFLFSFCVRIGFKIFSNVLVPGALLFMSALIYVDDRRKHVTPSLTGTIWYYM
jgi:hypothetical protein